MTSDERNPRDNYLRNKDLQDNDLQDNDLRDNDLRARFALLRQEEQSQAPAFKVLSPTNLALRQTKFAGKLIAVTVCIVIISAALWLRLPWWNPFPSRQPVVSLAQWHSPTDFLLETPGREILRTVPEIGVWHDSAKASTDRRKSPQPKKQVLP